jgi:hypothetical protein
MNGQASARSLATPRAEVRLSNEIQRMSLEALSHWSTHADVRCHHVYAYLSLRIRLALQRGRSKNILKAALGTSSTPRWWFRRYD